MVHVPLHRDFEQEMCGKCPKRYANPDGGSDPIALEPTDGPIHTQCIRNSIWSHTQCIRNPVWSVLTHGTGVAG